MKYAVGDQIGEYRITGHLGTGATGDVFRVEHSITQRVEAIKVFYASSLDAERGQRIQREAMLQARLNHPNITAVHTAFWSDGNLLLVMEYIEGRSLRQILDGGPVTLSDALGYGRQILQALGHAHQNGVMHRDISPANILVTGRGHVKLTDFGLAKKPGDRRITQSGTMMGSLHYTAPEQIRSSAEVDFRADLYSTGALLYELVAGRKPFEADSPFDLMLAHAEAMTVPPSHWQPSLPAHIDGAILRALEKDPQRRFTSAAEFLKNLEPPHREPKRVAAPVWAGAAFLSVAAAFTVIGLTRKPVPPVTHTSSAPPVIVTPSPVQEPVPPPTEPLQPVAEPLPIPDKVETVAAKPKRRPAIARTVTNVTKAERPNLSPPQSQPLKAEEVLPAAPPQTASIEAAPAPVVENHKTVEGTAKPGRGFWPNLRQRINIFRRRP